MTMVVFHKIVITLALIGFVAAFCIIKKQLDTTYPTIQEQQLEQLGKQYYYLTHREKLKP